MDTKKKNQQYELQEEDPTIVEEPFIRIPTLNLDLSKRYTYADYLTWFDDVRRELIDGFIHLMSAPARIHAQISTEVLLFIGTFITKTVHVFLLQPNGMYNSGTIYECDEKAPVHIFEGLKIDLKELFKE